MYQVSKHALFFLLCQQGTQDPLFYSYTYFRVKERDGSYLKELAQSHTRTILAEKDMNTNPSNQIYVLSMKTPLDM